jgi:hypothetical protein
MKRILTITDLTRMQEPRVCIAGYLPDGTCVRPVPRGGGLLEGWLKAAGQVVIRPFALVEFDLQERAPHPPHTEDWFINPLYRVNRGMLAPDEQKALLARLEDGGVEKIFGAAIHRDPGYYVKTGEGKRSLGTIRLKAIGDIVYELRENGKWDYRLAFTDQTGARYRLAVTDLAFRYYLDNLRVREKISPGEATRSLVAALQKAQVFLRIGLARGWDRFPDRCYMQVTGVYSFPDYLSARCFADLAVSAEDAPESSHG